MSAPDTNIEKQQSDHAPSLMGIKGAMLFGALMMFGLACFALFRADNYGASAYGETASGAPTTTGVIVSETLETEGTTGVLVTD